MDKTPTKVKPMVLDYEEICRMAPFFKGRKKLVDRLFRLLSIDKVNDIHARNCDTPGVEFTTRLLNELNIKLRIDNEQALDHLPQGAFITVSNHAYGALDGIILINMIASRRPQYKVICIDRPGQTSRIKTWHTRGHNASETRRAARLLPCRSSIKTQPPLPARRPQMAAVGNTHHQDAASARCANLFPWRQQCMVQLLGTRELATAHTAVAGRSIQQEKRNIPHLGRRHDYARRDGKI